jgi:sec-independent protein translocase protein TatA
MEGCGAVFSFSMPELALILVIALVVFGPGKLPEVGKALGKGMNEFRRAMDPNAHDTVTIEAKPVDKADDKADPKKDEAKSE